MLKKIIIALLLLPIFAGALFAGTVKNIRFEQKGAGALDEAVLLMNIRTRVGQQYNASIADDDVKRLYSTGYFSDVKVVEKALDAEAGEVVFSLTLMPMVSELVFNGNTVFGENALKNTVTLGIGEHYNDAKLQESLRKIRELYRSEGYNQASVGIDLEKADEKSGDLRIIFNIIENLRYRINDVNFVGATVYGNRQLRSVMANRHSYLSRFFEIGLYDESELELDKIRLRELYQEKGYLDFQVTAIQTSPDPDNAKYIDLTLTLEEGEPYVVGNIKIDGNQLIDTKTLLNSIPLESGKVFSLSDENMSRRRIIGMYETQGFSDFSCRVERLPDYSNHKVDIVFHLIEGRKYFVREINISGNSSTKDKVIRRELAIQPGDPVDRGRMEVSKSRLMGMGYFKKVEVNTVNADAFDEKDIDIQLEENLDRFGLRFGAGYSDVNNFVGMLELYNSNFDITNPGDWFYGGGQRFRLRGIAGVDTYGFNLDFTDPWLFDRRIRFDFSGYYNEINYEYWDESRAGARVAFGHRVFDDFTNLTLAYKFEQANISKMKSYMPDAFKSAEGNDWVSQISVLLDRDTRDSLLDPSRGYNVSLLGAVSPRALGSTKDFYRLEAKGSYYASFFDRAIIAMIGGKIGVVDTFGGGSGEVPLYERYFLGGGDTVRGFSYRDIGPRNGNYNYGGQSMLILTTEISHPIWDFIRGAIFLDAGNTWSDSYDYGFGDINMGLGYGLRIRVPQINAPIKLDLAYPVMNNQDGERSKWRFHFNMGFTF